MELKENHKWIKSFENRYAADQEGNIWSYLSGDAKKLSLHLIKSGYYIITLSNGFRHKAFLAAPLILSSFIERPSKEYIVSFKDNNKLNLKLNNLEWKKKSFVLRKKSIPVKLFKDGEILTFNTISDARIFLKQKGLKEIREASKNKTFIKGYNIEILK